MRPPSQAQQQSETFFSEGGVLTFTRLDDLAAPGPMEITRAPRAAIASPVAKATLKAARPKKVMRVARMYLRITS
eukprot:CAMPEP_0202070894 /NCGR_PEP_ID=MMETSP0964-20121228/1463_1 /ASSEMBLY_ACC=CAM_ASM_000500 /TAXON_ID=4773 /ORGANISM="Schizochytrium aggregatum, Strain ATCC28209" /LENGTH=74 /DNA_ID=CAMNT_0048637813 /DNA_START=70 /DNA_END=292 /DNA_ORIENTATION=-